MLFESHLLIIPKKRNINLLDGEKLAIIEKNMEGLCHLAKAINPLLYFKVRHVT
jgi:hypothetical protein